MPELSDKGEVPKQLVAEQKKLMAEMRRRTSLSDEEIHAILSPFSEAAFAAGYKLGRSDAEASEGVWVFRYRFATLALSALVVAWFVASRFL